MSVTGSEKVKQSRSDGGVTSLVTVGRVEA
jgi:hypothetical protein